MDTNMVKMAILQEMKKCNEEVEKSVPGGDREFGYQMAIVACSNIWLRLFGEEVYND